MKNLIKLNKTTIGMVSALAMLPMAGSAATINWSTSVDLLAGGNNTDFISQNGTFAVGINGGTTTTTQTIGDSVFTATTSAQIISGVTANGVTLIGDFASDAGPTTFGDGGFNGLNDIFDLLNSAVYAGTSLTMSGLTIGNQYEIQLMGNDARGTNRSGYMIGVTDDATLDVFSRVANLNNFTAASELSGDYLIGTFTADAASQTFRMGGTRAGNYVDGQAYDNPNGGQAQINALQVRDLGVVPEPSSTALLGLGGLALILRRKK